MDFVEDFVYFGTRRRVQSMPVIFDRNRASSSLSPFLCRAVRYRCIHGERSTLLVLAEYSIDNVTLTDLTAKRMAKEFK